MALMDVNVNATRILHTIWMNPGISRIGLSRELNLNKSTITKIVSTLLDERLVMLADSPDATTSKGRKPTGLFLNTEKGVVIGIEIETDGWIGVAVSLNGELLDTFTSNSISSDSSLEPTIRDAIDTARVRMTDKGYSIIGVGLGVSGQVDPYSGILISSNPLNVHQAYNVREFASEHYPFPVVIENDANCCCWNVIMDKKANRERNFICLLAELRRTGWGVEQDISEIKGVGVGLGLVIKDSVLHGEKFSAGEFQSVFKRENNPTQFALSLEELNALYTDNRVWEQVVREMGRNIALLVNTLNMSMVKIFGTFVLDGNRMREIFWEEIQDNWLYDDTVACDIEIAESGKEAVAVGAAGYFLNRVFTVPDIWEGNETVYPEGIELLRMGICAASEPA